jgi:MFS family permease
VAELTVNRVRTPEFRWLVSAQAVSMIGNAMTSTALFWLAIHLSDGHALGLAAVSVSQFLPMLVLSRRAGLVAVRHPAASVLVVTTAAEAAGAVSIGASLTAGWMTLWLLCLLSCGIGCAQTLGQPAGQIFLMDLVGADQLRRAASIISMITGISKIAGPALAGFLIAATGTGPVFLADGASFCGVVGVMIWLARVVQTPPDRAAGGAASVRRFRWVLDLPRGIQLTAVMALLIGGFGYQFEITNPLMATRVFHLGAAEFGILGTLMAAGGIAGSYYSAHRPSQPHGSEFALWSLVFGIAACAAALMPVPWAYAATMVVVGATITLFAITATVYIRQQAPPAQLGAALSAYNTAYIGFVPAGAFCVAGIAALAGTRWAILAPAIAVVVAAVAMLTLGSKATQHPENPPASTDHSPA